MDRKLRNSISAVLVRWQMPTRQIAITEIIALMADDLLTRDQEAYKKGYIDGQLAADKRNRYNGRNDTQADQNQDDQGQKADR